MTRLHLPALAALAAACATVLPAAPAAAGEFVVPFSEARGMPQQGWTPKVDGFPACGFEGTGTVWLGAGTLGAGQGCFMLFQAPGASTIRRFSSEYRYVKASADPSLCVRSFADGQAGDAPLRRCDGVGPTWELHTVGGSSWLELGLRNEGGSAIGIGTARANNVVFREGAVVLDDPTQPGVSIAQPAAQTGESLTAAWTATDPESSIGHVSLQLGETGREVMGDACEDVFRCGATRSGTGSLPLDGVPDGTHRLTVAAASAGGVRTAETNVVVDRIAPRAGLALPTPVRAWHGGDVVTLALEAADPQITHSRLDLLAGSGVVHTRSWTGRPPTGVDIPFEPGWPAGVHAAVLTLCSDSGCTPSEARFNWDPLPAPPAADVAARPWVGAAALERGVDLLWPPLAAAPGASGLRGAHVGIGRDPAAARSAALAAGGEPTGGTPGTAVTHVPAASLDGWSQACVALRPVSGAGVAQAAPGIGTRCVGIDAVAPTAALDAPAGWQRTPAFVSAAFADAGGSGLASRELTRDGTAVAADEPLVLAGEGVHVLRAQAADGAGNLSPAATATVRIDRTPPSVSLPAPDDWSAGDVTLRPAFADEGGSGLAERTLLLDGLAVDPAAPLVVREAGVHLVAAGARDVAGHEAEPASALVRIDRTAPTVALAAPAGWRSTPAAVRADFEDEGGSGVAQRRLTVDGVAVDPDLAAVVGEDGDHLVRATVVDGAGNAQAAEARVRIDAAPPSASLDAPSGWVGRAVVTARFSDAGGSGLAERWLTAGGRPADPAAPLVLEVEGTHAVRAGARDVAGNAAAVRDAVVQIDRTPPRLVAAPEVSYLARRIVVRVADGGAGVASGQLALAGETLETVVTPLGSGVVELSATAPAGSVLDGSSLAVVASDRTAPANVLETGPLPLAARPQAALGGVRARGCSGERSVQVGGCVAISGQLVGGGAGDRVTLQVDPVAASPQELRINVADGGAFTARVTATRGASYAVSAAASERLRAAPARAAAGEVAVRARISGLRVRVKGGRLAVSARYSGRGERARARLLVQVGSHRWVDACRDTGRPALALAVTGAIGGSCPIPVTARGRAWRYRVVLATPATTWPWVHGPSRAVTVRLPR